MIRKTNKRDIENLAILLQESESEIGNFACHDVCSNNITWMCYHGGEAKYVDIDWFTLTGRFLQLYKNTRLHFCGEKVEVGFFIPMDDSRIHFRQYLKGYDAYDRLDVILEQAVGKEIQLVRSFRLFLLK